MLVIRLARRGRKKQAFFELVVAEKSQAVKKKFIAKLGTFNPLTNKGEGLFNFNQELVEKYIKNGAQVSQSAARLLVKNGCKLAEKFVEKRVTKPKKEEPKPEVKEESTEAPKEDNA